MKINIINEYQCSFFFLLPSLALTVGCAVFLSILYLIKAMLSFFFLLSYSGEIVLESFEVSFEDSIFGDVS